MPKQITAFPKKKKRKLTAHDINKIHQRQLDILDRYSPIYKLSQTMRTLWEVVFQSGESIGRQLNLLREKTGERWYRQKYWRFRKRLENDLKR